MRLIIDPLMWQGTGGRVALPHSRAPAGRARWRRARRRGRRPWDSDSRSTRSPRGSSRASGSRRTQQRPGATSVMAPAAQMPTLQSVALLSYAPFFSSLLATTGICNVSLAQACVLSGIEKVACRSAGVTGVQHHLLSPFLLQATEQRDGEAAKDSLPTGHGAHGREAGAAVLQQPPHSRVITEILHAFINLLNIATSGHGAHGREAGAAVP